MIMNNSLSTNLDEIIPLIRIDFMNWREWIDINTIKTLSHHASGVVAGMIFYRLISCFIGWITPDGMPKDILIFIDGCTQVALLVWLIKETGYLFWLRRVKSDSAVCFMVA